MRSSLPSRALALALPGLLLMAGAAAAEDPVSLATGVYYYGKHVAQHQADLAEAAAEAQAERLGPLFAIVSDANATANDALRNGTAGADDLSGQANQTGNDTQATALWELDAAHAIADDEHAALLDAIEGGKAQVWRVEGYGMGVAIYQLSRF